MVQIISGLELKRTETDKTELIHWENVTFRRRQCYNQNQIDFPAFKTGFGCKGENSTEYEILAGHCFYFQMPSFEKSSQVHFKFLTLTSCSHGLSANVRVGKTDFG